MEELDDRVPNLTRTDNRHLSSFLSRIDQEVTSDKGGKMLNLKEKPLGKRKAPSFEMDMEVELILPPKRPHIHDSTAELDMVGDVSFKLLRPFTTATLPEDLSWDTLLSDYDAGIPLYGKPEIYSELCSTKDGHYLSDSPIEALGSRLINDAQLPKILPKVGFISSFFTSATFQAGRASLGNGQIWREGHGNLELLKQAKLFIFPINIPEVHWYLIIYHSDYTAFLVLDSANFGYTRYQRDILRCRQILNDALGHNIGDEVNIVVNEVICLPIPPKAYISDLLSYSIGTNNQMAIIVECLLAWASFLPSGITGSLRE
jgi:hypothetical protein